MITALLLIDQAVPQYEKISGAANPSTLVVLFDSHVDTWISLQTKIRAAIDPLNAPTICGIVQHSPLIVNFYRMLETQTSPCRVYNVETMDPELSTWSELIEFYTFLKSMGMTTIDLISCALFSNTGFVYVLTQLEARLGIDIRASINNTGNIASGGDWIQESDGINIKEVYFTDDISAYTNLLFYYTWRNSVYMCRAPGATVNGNKVPGEIVKPMMQTQFSTPESFTPLGHLNGGARAWGWVDQGAHNPPATITSSGVTSIASNWFGFAAMRNNGSVISWGDATYTGGVPTGAGSGVVGICGGTYSFTALRSDGRVFSWGGAALGASGAPTDSGYTKVATNWQAYAAIKNDGSVFSWGNSAYGGIGQPTNGYSGVIALSSTFDAFAALKDNGSVIVWGNAATGGGSAPEAAGNGVVALTANGNAFAALKSDGSVVAWGSLTQGGSGVPGAAGSGVIAIAATATTFAALKSNGAVHTWGENINGLLTVPGAAGSGVVAITSALNTYLALRSDGIAVCWGQLNNIPTAAQSGIVAVSGGDWSLSVMRSDGTYISWGGLLEGRVAGGGGGSAVNALRMGNSSLSASVLRANGTLSAWGDYVYWVGTYPTNTAPPTGSGFVTLTASNTNFATILPNSRPTVASTAITNDDVGNYIYTSTDSNETIALNMRTGIFNAAANKKDPATLAFVRTMRIRNGENKLTISSGNFNTFKASIISGAQFLFQNYAVDLYFPDISPDTKSASLDVADFVTNSSKYISIEMPYNIPIYLYENYQVVKTLFFDGSKIYEGSSAAAPEITPGSRLTFGTKTISQIAVGSLTGFGGTLPSPPTPRPIRPFTFDRSIRYVWDSTDSAVTSFELTLNGTTTYTIAAGSREYIVTGLTNGTNYSATLVAKSGTVSSSVVSFRDTVPGFLASEPQSVTFTQVNSNTLRVTWSTPTSDGGSPIGWYVLQTTDKTTIRQGIEPFRREYVLVGVPAGQHTFQLSAINSMGYGAPVVSQMYTFS